MPTLARVPLADIDEPANPVRCEMDQRKMDELIESMRVNGLLQPIGLKRRDLRFEVEFGHRRFLAATQLRWRDIPAMIYEDGELQEGAAMIAENAHREDVNAAEEGLLFAQAAERFSLDEAGLMKRFNVSQDYLGDRMRLVREGGKVFDALLHRQINFSVARELNKCGDREQREYYLDCAIRSQTGHRVVAEWVKDWRLHVTPPQGTPAADTPPQVETPSQGNPLACFVCGGDKDPWNIVAVYVHKRELEAIMDAMKREQEA